MGARVFDVVESYEGKEERERVEREAQELLGMLTSNVLPSETERVRAAVKVLGEGATAVDVVIYLRENGNLGTLSERQVEEILTGTIR